jgi:hypothetical protein
VLPTFGVGREWLWVGREGGVPSGIGTYALASRDQVWWTEETQKELLVPETQARLLNRCGVSGLSLKSDLVWVTHGVVVQRHDNHLTVGLGRSWGFHWRNNGVWNRRFWLEKSPTTAVRCSSCNVSCAVRKLNGFGRSARDSCRPCSILTPLPARKFERRLRLRQDLRTSRARDSCSSCGTHWRMRSHIGRSWPSGCPCARSWPTGASPSL